MRSLIFGLVSLAVGVVLLIIPNKILTLVVWTVFGISLLGVILQGVEWLKKRTLSDFFLWLASLAFLLFLISHPILPQWLLRVGLGWYALLNAYAIFVQFLLNLINRVKHYLWGLWLSVLWLAFGLFLLFRPHFQVELLLQMFGVYLLLLAIRHIQDGLASINPLVKNAWKRRFRLSLPLVVYAFFPEWMLISINRALAEPGNYQQKQNEPSELEVLVHVGAEGLAKIGHIGFCYKGLVYNYGNYDLAHSSMSRLFGRAILYTAKKEKYLDVLCGQEKNTIFSYGVKLNQEGRLAIEQALDELYTRLDVWHPEGKQMPVVDSLKPSATFYRIKEGKFKYYWVLGDNCALFTDYILGSLGADVLAMRGILTPGTYLDWLQTEWLKQNSPIISFQIYGQENQQ